MRADTQRGLPAPEKGESEYRGDGLREHGAVGGSLDAHIERDDEKGIKKDVAHRADYLRAHGVLRVSAGAHEEIRAEAEEREGRAEQDDPQIRARHFEHLSGASGETQHCVCREKARGDRGHADDRQQDERRRQRLFRGTPFVRAEEDRDPGGAADTDEQREGHHHHHHRKTHRNCGKPHRTDVAPDKDTVNYIINSAGYHADDGRQRKTQYKPRYRLAAHAPVLFFF